MAIFLHPIFLASRVQHISDLHSKFALSVEVWWDLLRVWYGRPHLAQIDPIVLDFAIFPALGNGGLKVSSLFALPAADLLPSDVSLAVHHICPINNNNNNIIIIIILGLQIGEKNFSPLKKRKIEERNHRAKHNGLHYFIGRP